MPELARRKLLTALSGGAVATGGCLGSTSRESVQEPTPSPTATDGQRSTVTPTQGQQTPTKTPTESQNTLASNCESANEDFERITLEDSRHIKITEDGAEFTNKLIDAQGHELRIDAHAPNFTVANIGVINSNGVNARIHPKVRDPDGHGVVENLYMENITNNFSFVNRKHEGHITYRNCTFINNVNPPENKEDAIYGSGPGNFGDEAKPIGWGGTVDVIGCYFRSIGGYGVRLGSPGSRCINTTVTGPNTWKALANLFGGSFDGYEGNHGSEPPYVLFKDCDVGGGVRMGLQVGNHVDVHQQAMDYAAAVQLENVSIDAERPIFAPKALGGDGERLGKFNGEPAPSVNPSIDQIDGVDGDPDLSPPQGAPLTARQAASGAIVCDKQ